MNEEWLVNVAVANVWTNYDSPREVDRLAITKPVKVREWLDSLSYEQKLELCESNLVQSQVLYGQNVFGMEEKEGMVHVLVPDQPSSKNSHGYPGWISKDQLTTKLDFPVTKIVMVKKQTAFLYDEQMCKIMEISYQTRLPFVKENAEWIHVHTPNGDGLIKKEDVEVYQDVPTGSGERIVTAAETFLNLPYLWGGMSGFGFDCSGFAYTIYRANGYTIPRDAHEQAEAGQPVSIVEPLRGDLLFFAHDEGKGRVHHVGIYYGDGKMIHAPKTGKSVEIIKLEGTIYKKELCGVRRYWV